MCSQLPDGSGPSHRGLGRLSLSICDPRTKGQVSLLCRGWQGLVDRTPSGVFSATPLLPSSLTLRTMFVYEPVMVGVRFPRVPGVGSAKD